MNKENFNLADREINIKDKGSINKGILYVVFGHIACIMCIFTLGVLCDSYNIQKNGHQSQNMMGLMMLIMGIFFL